MKGTLEEDYANFVSETISWYAKGSSVAYAYAATGLNAYTQGSGYRNSDDGSRVAITLLSKIIIVDNTIISEKRLCSLS